MIFWLPLELQEERVVEVYGRSAIQRRKTGVRLLCLEALMSRHLELQAVAVLLKEVWQVPCKMHWQSESRRLAAVVSVFFFFFPYLLPYITYSNCISQMMRRTTMTIGKLSLALATVIVSLFVVIWLLGGFMDFCIMGKPCIVSMGFSQRWFTNPSKAFVSRHPFSRRIEQVFAHRICVDANTNERLTERHSIICRE